MFDALEQMTAAWREIAYISAWTGLSVGALIVCGLLVFYVPLARKAAVVIAVMVVVAFVCLLHGAAVGRADVEARWAGARIAAQKARVARDGAIEQQLEAKYGPQLADITQQANDNKARADSYESKMVALLALARPGKGRRAEAGKGEANKDRAAPGGACDLGAAADRLRQRQR